MNNTDSFWGWVRKEKFSVYFSLSIFIIPYACKLLNLVNDGKVFDISFELIYDICHVIFILISLIMLVNSVFLMDVNGEGNKFRLFSYVKEIFGENSNIVKNGQDGLFKIVEVTIRQFYYSWIAVWCIWLLMYVNNLVYYIYSYACSIDEVLFRYKCFCENILNLSNSFVLFFIYFVITVSSVNVSTNERSRSQLHTGVIVLIFLGMVYFSIDYQAIFTSIFSQEFYSILQFYLRIVVGISATVALMGVLGRLNSSFLNIPQGLIICLYVYASLQMIYPMIYENSNGVGLFHGSTHIVRHGLYILAFAGKVCLFFVIRWIIQKRRFIFFVIHKAHSLAESENMLKKFNRFMGE